MEKKLQKPYPTDCNLLIGHDLWQARYQILLILLKEFIKLNADTNTMIKKMKLAKSNVNFETAFLNT